MLPMPCMGSMGAVGAPELPLAVQVANLFATYAGPKLWLDPSDISTLQQDSAGATPVTAVGQSIGRIMDKSGAANHALQATAGSLPLWQTNYADFDGVNDSLATPAIDFSSTDKVTIIAGAYKASDASTGMLYELSVSLGANNGTFYLTAPATAATPNYVGGTKGTVGQNCTATPFAAPHAAVLTQSADIAGSSSLLRVNGTPFANASSLGAGAFGVYPLYIGRRANSSLPFSGRIYGLMIFGRPLTASELSVCERYMAQKVGVVF